MHHPNHRLRLEIKEITEAGEFEGMLSTYGNEDLGGDIIQRGAFGASLKSRAGKIRILLDHDVTKRAGTGFVTETPEGLHCKGVLNLASPYGQQAYAEVKFYQEHGPAMELSIGYKTKKDRWERNVRHVLEGDLWEGSLVCFAMNPQAVVTSVKAQEAGMPGQGPAGSSTAGSSTPPETKEAAPFERVYRWMMLWERRYRMADALWSSVQSILEDGGLDEAAQDGAAQESLGQFGQEMLAWMAEYRAVFAEASTTTLAAALVLDTKAGRVLSARNQQLLAAAVEALSAVLKAATPAEDEEEEDDEAEEDEESKGSNPPAADEHAPTLESTGVDPQALVSLAAEMRSFVGGLNHHG